MCILRCFFIPNNYQISVLLHTFNESNPLVLLIFKAPFTNPIWNQNTPRVPAYDKFDRTEFILIINLEINQSTICQSQIGGK